MIYIADTKQGVLRESPGKWPSCDDVVDENLEGTFKERLIEYHRISENPNVYPLIGDGWEDKKEYQRNEFEIVSHEKQHRYTNGEWARSYSTYEAARLKKQPEESQEQLLEDFYKNWCKETKRAGGVLITTSIHEFIKELSKTFTITRK